jgi:hypothetical protein
LALVASALATIWQDDLAAKVETRVAELGDDQYEVRERAMEELRALGPEIEEHLRRHADRNRDPEIGARLASLLSWVEDERIRRALSFRVERDESGALKVGFVNGSKLSLFILKTRYGNGFSITRIHADGTHRGRLGGRMSTGCNLQPQDFVRLAPGEVLEVERIEGAENLDRLVGLELSYRFSRAAYVARCRRCSVGHADPSSPWNLAMELEVASAWKAEPR